MSAVPISSTTENATSETTSAAGVRPNDDRAADEDARRVASILARDPRSAGSNPMKMPVISVTAHATAAIRPSSSTGGRPERQRRARREHRRTPQLRGSADGAAR